LKSKFTPFLATAFSIAIFADQITAAAAQSIERQYNGFVVAIDCEKRGPIGFYYQLGEDRGNQTRQSRFFHDPDVNEDCQQTSVKSYKRPSGEPKYDRGHLVPANHMDNSAESIRQSNYMTNVLPQALQMNRGAWLLTEEITECHRDLEPLEVWGGVIWGNDPSDDHFVESHGVTTPEAYWKVILKSDRGIAWVIPNKHDATRSRLDNYLVSLDHIEDLTGLDFPLPEDLESNPLPASWVLPRGCDKS
tara:strand:- start:1617 stop:2360 length:744 start_codon:yes stop_codon:yes gene_type:complete